MTVPTRDVALELADELAKRGHRLIAVRIVDHFAQQPDSSWYDKPTSRPDEQGMWDVFSLADGPLPSDDENWWAAQELRVITRLAREHGGHLGIGGAGATDHLRKYFERAGLVHELDDPTVTERRRAALGALAPRQPREPLRPTASATAENRIAVPIVLDGLGEIEWGSLDHAYGNAGDVPSLLQALAANDDAWTDSLDALLGSVLHQDSCYSSTPDAMRFLARITLNDNLSAQRRTEIYRTLCYAGTLAAARQASSQRPRRVDIDWDERVSAAVSDEVPGLLRRRATDDAERHALILLAALIGDAAALDEELVAFGTVAASASTALSLALITHGETAALNVLNEAASWHERLGVIVDSPTEPRARVLAGLHLLVDEELTFSA